jgi:hypothetical protein
MNHSFLPLSDAAASPRPTRRSPRRGRLALGLALLALDVLVEGTGLDDLLALALVIDGLRLERIDGSTTGNLLAGPVRVELIGLDGAFRWIAGGTVPGGTYVAVRVSLDPTATAALSSAGVPLEVVTQAGDARIELSLPLALAGSIYRRLILRFDLLGGLAGDLATGPLSLAPAAEVRVEEGTLPLPLDEVSGRVSDRDIASGVLEIEAFADDSLAVPLRTAVVVADPLTLLVNRDGQVFSSVALYFTLLTPITLVEVHGTLGPGRIVRASRIEIEDQNGVPSTFVVELRGRLVGGVPPSLFVLQLRSLEKGAAIAQPVLAGLPEPGLLEIVLDPGTPVFLAGDVLGTRADLAVGQDVEAKFTFFSSEPFQAARVAVPRPVPRFAGVLLAAMSPSLAPRVLLRPDDPAVLAGLVAPGAPVEIALDGAAIRLDLPGVPLLTAAALLPGLRVQLRGALSGPPGASALAVSEVLVRPGRLDGAEVESIDADAGTLSVAGGVLRAPFGALAPADPLLVRAVPGVVVRGDAESPADLFALFLGLEPGERLLVNVEGVGLATPDEVAAFRISVTLEP